MSQHERPKYVYSFEEGSAGMKRLLGGKGANLAEMTRIGVPVPPGFTLTTKACIEYMRRGREFIDEIWPEVLKHIRKLEEKTGRKFGGVERPLLVSVRSGAPVSMPGMMDTVLNVGLNDETVKGLAKLAGERFAYDSYRRLLSMYGSIVMGVPREEFERLLEEKKRKYGVKADAELPAEALRELVEEYKRLIKERTGREFPQNPLEQVKMAVEAVFRSWNGRRAVKYRRIHGIPDDLGTAVNIVAMVFGNMGWDSGTGVAFTRNPATGENRVYGEYLPNAQGEDVVAGIRTPMHIDELGRRHPELYKQLIDVCRRLERHYRDMQDIEFTVEQGRLWILQTRTGKRTPLAAVKMAVDMAEEGLITREEAVLRVSPEDVEKLLHKQVDPSARKEPVAKGLPASPGAAVGKVVFDSDEAEELGKREPVILVRPETTPEDVGGMAASQGILTARGGMTSHAAVVARGMGKPCIVGCEAIKIDLEKEEFRVGDLVVKKGDWITIDGSTGEVMAGKLPLVEPKPTAELEKLLKWADEIRDLGVYANADLPADIAKAIELGAEGIGLARTEHMFLGDRLPIFQRVILAETEEERRRILMEELMPLQKEDFKEILRIADGKKTIIRLLDPPLHEFLPNIRELLAEVAKLEAQGVRGEELEEKRRLLKKVEDLYEFNPMLGFRVCRLGVVYPEIYEAQIRAILEAAAELRKQGLNPRPAIMIPGVIHKRELEELKKLVEKVAKEVFEREGVEVDYEYGTMIEMPRAALTADELAEVVDFFSFGTNDLTQTVLGMSRDDAERRFLHVYIEKGILPENPFKTLDIKGVGQLMKMAVEKSKRVKPTLEIGICGEHGGDPKSIEFCHKIGMDYVSASPFRIPVARLAAAQAKLKHRR
ncbi:MAG: pyruvate, phosphate dikinase [Thermoproteota archaeon]|nr:MAG: pyruvate, phosphate dikinase [Candidatus Korarchaeota archaeon]